MRRAASHRRRTGRGTAGGFLTWRHLRPGVPVGVPARARAVAARRRRHWLGPTLASGLLAALLVIVAHAGAAGLPGLVFATAPYAKSASASTPACPGVHQPPLYTAIYGAHLASQTGPVLNEVALTFDDGPTPYTSPAIFSVLERTHTPATFFVLGQYVHLWPYLVQREWRDGFAIGVHTWDHPLMTTLSQARQDQEFNETIDALHQALGNDACFWFWRPPYGDYNGTVLQTARSFGLTTIMWNDDPADWSRPGTQVIASRVLAQVGPASIILMHDGPALRDQTAAALPIILDGLRTRGLRPVTIPQLLADEQYPGIALRHEVLAPGSSLPSPPPGPPPLCRPQPSSPSAGNGGSVATPAPRIMSPGKRTSLSALNPSCEVASASGP
jgi:peptidoglycan/xylan/chitin deacetylase (PgdA/CDA1 family)